MKILTDYGQLTTFHGLNHAVATNSRTGRYFWIIMFLVGGGIAGWQCCTRLLLYINDDSNVIKQEREVLPEHLAEVHYFKVCPTYWINRDKVKSAVLQGKLTYRNLLFALSLLPSVSRPLLREIGGWDEIREDSRIWGIPRCKSELVLSMRRKKRALDGLTNDVHSYSRGRIEYNTLLSLEEAGVIGELGQNLSVAGAGYEVYEMSINLYASLKTTNLKILHRRRMISCAMEQSMQNWRKEAQSFYHTSNGLYATLTHFFASIANNFNPLTSVGGKHVRWEITGSGLCQVTELSAKGLSAANGLVVDLDVPYELTNATIDSLEVDIIPFAIESTYSKNIHTTGQGKIGPSYSQSAFGAAFLQNHRIGSKTRLTYNLPYVARLDRHANCINSDGKMRIPDGYAYFRCKAGCRKHNEHFKAQELNGYRMITENDIGDIPLNQKMAPAGYAKIAVNLDKAAKCMDAEACGSTHFCKEWKIDSSIQHEEDVYFSQSPSVDGDYNGVADNNFRPQESLLQFEVSLGLGLEIRYGRRLDVVDMMGIIGGILGLYLGCSILTIVHRVAFWVKKLYDRCR